MLKRSLNTNHYGVPGLGHTDVALTWAASQWRQVSRSLTVGLRWHCQWWEPSSNNTCI